MRANREAAYRELAAAIPDAYRDDLANSLSSFSSLLSAFDRSAKAKAALDEVGMIRGSNIAAIGNDATPNMRTAND